MSSAKSTSIITPTTTPTTAKSTTLQYQFTRHMQSCNNIEMGKLSGKDYEPSVSLYGIVKTIEFSQKEENKKDFKSDTVFVSNLLRTWITALILYGSGKPDESGKSELNLYISPYLKEKTTTIKAKNQTIIELKRPS